MCCSAPALWLVGGCDQKRRLLPPSPFEVLKDVPPPIGLDGAKLFCRRLPPCLRSRPALLSNLITRSSCRSTLSSLLNSLLVTGGSKILLVGPLVLSVSVTTVLLMVGAGRVTTLPTGAVPLIGVGGVMTLPTGVPLAGIVAPS